MSRRSWKILFLSRRCFFFGAWWWIRRNLFLDLSPIGAKFEKETSLEIPEETFLFQFASLSKKANFRETQKKAFVNSFRSCSPPNDMILNDAVFKIILNRFWRWSRQWHPKDLERVLWIIKKRLRCSLTLMVNIHCLRVMNAFKSPRNYTAAFGPINCLHLAPQKFEFLSFLIDFLSFNY